MHGHPEHTATKSGSLLSEEAKAAIRRLGNETPSPPRATKLTAGAVPFGVNAVSTYFTLLDDKYRNIAKYPEGSPRQQSDRRAAEVAAAYPHIAIMIEWHNQEPLGKLIEFIIGRNPSKWERDMFIDRFLSKQPKINPPNEGSRISPNPLSR